MFQKTDVTLWAGVNSAVSLQGRRLRWYCAHDGAGNRWGREFDLPRGMSAGDVGSICPSSHGLTVVAKDGALHVYDAQRGDWTERGNALRDGGT